MHRRILLPGLLDLPLVLTFVPAALADTVPEPVDLAFIVDGSGRFSNTDFHIMLNGIPDAITNSQCVPQDPTLWLTVVQFSSDANGPATATATAAHPARPAPLPTIIPTLSAMRPVFPPPRTVHLTLPRDGDLTNAVSWPIMPMPPNRHALE